MGAGTEIINNPGSDIRVYETNSFEQYSVYISQDMNEWVFVGDGVGTTEFDISSTGLSQARYVQVADGIKEEEASGDSPGADIDGVKALRFEKWPDKVLFNGGKRWWSGREGIREGSQFPAKKTVEFVIPRTLEQYRTKKFTVIVRYICAKESGPGFLQRPEPDTIYIADHHEHAIHTISLDVEPDGEKGEKTQGFEVFFSICWIISSGISFEKEEMKQLGCLGIYSACGEAGALRRCRSGLHRSRYHRLCCYALRNDLREFICTSMPVQHRDDVFAILVYADHPGVFRLFRRLYCSYYHPHRENSDNVLLFPETLPYRPVNAFYFLIRTSAGERVQADQLGIKPAFQEIALHLLRKCNGFLSKYEYGNHFLFVSFL